MRSTMLLGVAALSLTLLACDARPFTGPDVQPFALRAAPAGQSAPLIFLDGRRVPPGTSLVTLNAANITGIEVLKSGPALAKYGEAGRAGVVFITTRATDHAHR